MHVLIVLIRVADAVICEGIPDITSCRSEASEAIANVNIGDLHIVAHFLLQAATSSI